MNRFRGALLFGVMTLVGCGQPDPHVPASSPDKVENKSGVQPAPAAEVGPEEAVRTFLRVLFLSGTQNDLADITIPGTWPSQVPENHEPPTPEDVKETEAFLAKPMQILKPGDVFPIPDGGDYCVTSEDVGSDRAMILPEGFPAPLKVLHVDGHWKVDASLFWPALLFKIFQTAMWSFDEVARVTSPSGKFDAVLVETNGGATTSFGYEIYVVEKGKPAVKGCDATHLYAACRNESAYGANLRWDGNTVMVEYLSARDAGTRDVSMPMPDGQKVRVILKAGVTDPSAPGGGMLYNLTKSKAVGP